MRGASLASILGPWVRGAPIPTTHLINYSLGCKGKGSRSEARIRDLRAERRAPVNEAVKRISATRALRAGTGTVLDEGAATMARDSISEGLRALAQSGAFGEPV